MQTTTGKRFAISFLAFVVASVVFMASTALANRVGFKTMLPRWLGHTNVVAGHKDSYWSSNAYVRIHPGYKNGWYWVDRIGQGQVTDHYFVASGTWNTLPYYDDGRWTGSTMLRGHQEWWGPGADYVAGVANFG